MFYASIFRLFPERDGVARKPSTDGVDAALRSLGVSRDEAVYIGDSDVDIATAHNAGLPCLSVTWGFRDEAFLSERGADRLIRTVPELEQALLEGKDKKQKKNKRDEIN